MFQALLKTLLRESFLVRRADNGNCGKEKGKVEPSIDPNKFNNDNCVLHRFSLSWVGEAWDEQRCPGKFEEAVV